MSGIRIVAILTVIGVFSGAALAVVFAFTGPMIQENRRREARAAVEQVLPGAEKIESSKVDGLTVFRGLNGDGGLRGYAFPAEVSGFQGNIKMMIGMDTKLEKITGLVILENVETPGLGNRISEKSFRDRFIGLSGEEELRLVKNQPADKEQNEVEAITGATISSQAVVNGAGAEIKKIRRAGAGGSGDER